MNSKSLYLGIIMTIYLGGCTPHYISSRFSEITREHQVIAVVPFEMRFTGRMPDKLAEEDVLDLEEAESQAFQISFYNEVLRSTRNGRRSIRVDLQDYNKTLDLLDGHNIGIRDSWNIAPEELAKILNVDAVVRARIEKARFMSDLASYGIEVGMEIIHAITNYALWPWLSPFSNQSKAIIADFTLYDEKEGITLWSIAFDEGADWRRPAHEIIDEISRKAARKFPYRN